MQINKTKTKNQPKIFLIVFLLLNFLFANFSFSIEAFFENSEKNNFSPEIKNKKVVSFLVEKKLLDDEELRKKIERYVMDVQKKINAQGVLVPIPQTLSPKEIFEGNAHLYFSGTDDDQNSYLVGTVLIGEVPVPVVEKNKNFWVTIFPYLDFEDQNYSWDEKKNRFVFQEGDFSPEIWHGVIRSDADTFSNKVKELKNYFDKNHDVHLGNTNFSKKVFYANLPIQKKGLPDILRKKYENFIAHLEDIVYLRFNKYWAQEMLSKFDENDPVPWDELPEDVIPDGGGGMTDDVSQIPDIQAKNVIDNFIGRYFDAWKNHLTSWHSGIEQAGRWTTEDVDTTISLITRKDELSVLLLKAANDELEKLYLDAIRSANVANHISVPKVQSLRVHRGDHDETIWRDTYWNGVLRNKMNVKDCSLFRGKIKDELHPFSVLVEANRTYNSDTVESCSHKDEPGSNRNNDPYEGCCAKNMIVDEETGGFSSNGGCNTGSFWQNFSVVHYGAQKPVFDIKGTRELFEGQSGAIGCSQILSTGNEREDHYARFSSLMIHDEPTVDTIRQQTEYFVSKAMPVDDPRGVSFYDHAKNFHRLDFVNIFDLLNLHLPKNSTEEQKKQILTKKIKDDLQTLIENTNNITEQGNSASNTKFQQDRGVRWQCYSSRDEHCHCNFVEKTLDNFTRRLEWTRKCDHKDWEKQVLFYETGNIVSNKIFDQTLSKLDVNKIAEAIIWLRKDLEEKNRIVFEKALSDPQGYRIFFEDPDFSGYEFVEILGEKISADAIELDFEKGSEKFDEEASMAEKEKTGFSFDTTDEQNFLGTSFQDNFLSNSSEGNCKSDDFNQAMKCAAQSIIDEENQKQNIFLSDSGSPIFDTENTSIAKIKINPNSQIIFAGNVNPIDIEVLLLDENEKILANNFSSEVKIIFDDPSLASKFFSISPSQKITAQGGVAKFFIIPKKNNLSSDIKFFAKVEEKISDPADIKISQLKISASSDKTKIVAKNPTGIELEAKILNLDRKLSKKLDGAFFKFFSTGGEFQGENKIIIQEGKAKIRFFPGKKSGSTGIIVQDDQGLLPPKKLKIEILPDVPAYLDFDAPQDLVDGMDFFPIHAQVFDQWGNPVQNIEQDVTWKFENLEVAEFDVVQSRSLLTRQISGGLTTTDSSFEDMSLNNNGKINQGRSTIFIKPKENIDNARVEIFSDILGQKLSRSLNFKIIKNAKLKIDIEPKFCTAGQKNKIKVFVQAKTDDKKIPGNFDVEIFSKPANIFDYPSKFSLTAGEGSFEFFPGKKAGNTKIILKSNGFETAVQNFQIKPKEAKKILLSTEKQIFDFDEDEEITINISVADEYGNISYFSDKIFVYATSDTEENITKETSEVQINQGKGSFKIFPKKPGPVRLIAKKDDLILDILEIKIKKSLNIQSLENLQSKAFFSLFLGLDGHNFLDLKKLANRFLLTGNNQAVGTLTQPVEPAKRFGNISPFGQITGNLKTQLNFGEFFEIIFSSQDLELFKTRILFDSSNLKIKKQDFSKKINLFDIPGQYLFFDQNFSSEEDANFTQKNNQIFLNDEVIFSFSDKGGIRQFSSDIKFSLHENSENLNFPDTWKNYSQENYNIFYWDIFLKKKKIGFLQLVPFDISSLLSGDTDQVEKNKKISEYLSVIKEEESMPVHDSGIFIKILDSQILAKKIFVGASTHDIFGFTFYNPQEKEDVENILGSPKDSAEDALTKKTVWEGEWIPGILFGAKNSIGESTALGSSDNFILLGDPTLSIFTKNPKRNIGFSSDIGRPLWKSTEGKIKNLFSADINGDQNLDILAQVKNKLYVLFQDTEGTQNFRLFGPLLRFGDGGENISVINNDADNFFDLLQLNEKGEIIFHKNSQGSLIRQKLFDVEQNNLSKILDFKVARLNSDNFKDLVVLDDRNILWFIFGEEKNKFSAPQKLDQVAMGFDHLDENFSVAEVQSKKETDRLQYIANFPYLNQINISYAGIEAENLAEEKLIWKNKKVFVSLVENVSLDAEIKNIKKENNLFLPGKEIDFQLIIKPNKKLKNFVFSLPKSGNMEFLADSLICDKCENSPQIEIKKENILVSADVLKKDTPFKFFWKTKIEKIEPITFSVGDFDSEDDIDDILIPWEENGEKFFIKYLSKWGIDQANFYNKNSLFVGINSFGPLARAGLRTLFLIKNKLMPEDSAALAAESRVLCEAGNKKIFDSNLKLPWVSLTANMFSNSQEILHRKAIENFQSKVETKNPFEGSSEQEVAEYFKKELTSAGVDPNSLPAFFDKGTFSRNIDFSNPTFKQDLQRSMQELNEQKQNLRCGNGKCGIGILSKTIPPFAPGLDFFYIIPPFAIPMGMHPGLPIFAFPTTLITPLGPIPVAWPPSPLGMNIPNAPFFSQLRMYIMPTTTGAVGMGLCLGPYMTAMVPPVMINNCFATVVPLSLMSCDDGGGGNSANIMWQSSNVKSSNSGILVSVGNNTKKRAKIDLSKSSLKKNTQILPVDLFTAWMSKQWREIDNFQLPQLSVKLPDWSFDDSQSDVKDYKTSGELFELPFVTWKNYKINIPIPKINIDSLKKQKTELNNFKQKVNKWISDQRTELETYLSEVNISLDIEKVKQKIKANIDQIMLSIDSIEKQVDKNLEKLEETHEKIKNIDFDKYYKKLDQIKEDVHKSKNNLNKTKQNLIKWKENNKKQKELLRKKVEAQGPIARKKAENWIKDLEKIEDEIDKKIIKCFDELNDLSNQIEQNKKILDSYKKSADLDIEKKKQEAEKWKQDIKKWKQETTDKLKGSQIIKFDLEAFKNQIKLQFLAFFDSLKNIPIAIEENLNILLTYPEKIAVLKEIPNKVFDLILQTKKYVDTLMNFFGKFVSDTKNSIKKWLNARKAFIQMLKTWEMIPKIFHDFTVSCPTPGCSSNRGTLIEFGFKILAGAINFPVIPMPQLPNIIIDLSNISVGLTIPIPDVGLEEVELDIPSLIPDMQLPNLKKPSLDLKLEDLIPKISLPGVNLPIIPDFEEPDFEISRFELQEFEFPPLNLSFNDQYNLPPLDVNIPDFEIPDLPTLPDYPPIDFEFPNITESDIPLPIDLNQIIILPLPAIPKIPTLPELPDINLDFTLPPLSLPSLPTIPEPPTIPNILSPLTAFVAIPKALKSLLCLINMGVMPMPEWSLKSYVEQLTNRQIFISLDFLTPALSFSIPKPKMQDIVIAPKIDLQISLDVLVDILREIKQNFECIIKSIASSARGGEAGNNCQMSGGSEISLEKNINLALAQKKLRKTRTITFDLNKEISDEPNDAETKKYFAYIDNYKKDLENILKYDHTPKSNQVMQKIIASLDFSKKYDASFLSQVHPQKILPWLVSTQMLEDMPTPPPTELPEQNIKMEPGIYLLDPQTQKPEKLINFPIKKEVISMFIDLNPEEKDLDAAQKESIVYAIDDKIFIKNKIEPKESEQNFENIIFWDTDEFIQKFPPLQKMQSNIEASKINISFEPNKNISYLEWFINPKINDVLGIYQEEKNLNFSEKIGFFIRSLNFVQTRSSLTHQMSGGVTTDWLIQKIPRFAFIKKIKGSPEFFTTKKKFVPNCSEKFLRLSKKNYLTSTKNASRLQIKLSPEDMREEVLKFEEELILSNVEVCVMSGEVEFLDTKNQNLEKINFSQGDTINNFFEIHTKINDEVQLELFDKTIINIENGQKYTGVFLDNSENAKYTYQVPKGNFYSSFIGFLDNKKSFVLSKILHDPQFSDDNIPPKIRIQGGTTQNFSLNEKIIVKAEATFDDQNLKAVWWDLNPELDTDQDGDSTNDQDYPKNFTDSDISKFLNLKLPAREIEEIFYITLNVQDESDNLAQEIIEIKILSPDIELQEASVRDQKITGAISKKQKNIPIYFFRERDGHEELIKETPIFTDEKGQFELSDLRISGGIEIFDNNDQKIVEILETGRPIIYNKSFGINVVLSTVDQPFGIKVHDEKNQEIAFIDLTQDGTNDVVIENFLDFFDLENTKKLFGIHILDTNKNDQYILQNFSPINFSAFGAVAIVDNVNAQTFAILDRFGNFTSLAQGIWVRLKRSSDYEDPMVFEILNKDQVLGEFFINLEEGISVLEK